MPNDTSTIFDSVFKTIVHKAPDLMVPFINEVFGRNYPLDTPVVQFSNEHESPHGRIIDDSVFRLQNKIYHIECQSTPDSNMVLRMIEYDFAIALEQALAAGEPYQMDFPSSCVLFLRHTSHTPDRLTIRVNLPSGDSFDYDAKVVKAQQYESAELFSKHLLLLLPFYLMRYERSLDQIASDDVYTARLVEECVDLNARLASTVLSTGNRLLYEELIELIIRVSDYIMKEHETLQRKVRCAMGGEVLELLNDRAERLEREARQEGLERGMEQGLEALAEQLRSRGVSDDLIAQAIEDVRSQRQNASSKS